jgi:hypothetical protein
VSGKLYVWGSLKSEIGAIYCNPKSIVGPTVEGQDEHHKRIAVTSIQASSVTMSR